MAQDADHHYWMEGRPFLPLRPGMTCQNWSGLGYPHLENGKAGAWIFLLGMKHKGLMQ